MRAPWPGGSIATMPSPTKSDGVVNPERTILHRSVSGSISAARSALLLTPTFGSVPLPTGTPRARARARPRQHVDTRTACGKSIARFAGWATGGCRRSRCSSSKPCRSSPAEGTTALAQCIATVSRSSKRSPSSSISPTGSVECPPAQGQQAVARGGGTEHRCAVGNPITRAPNRIGLTAEGPRLGRQRT